MKNILFLYLIALSFILISCKKGSSGDAKISSRLIGVQDSMYLLSFIYEGDKITHANFSFSNSPLKSDYANFEYSGDTDIKVSSPTSDVRTEFFINDSKLPVRMTRHETGTDGTKYNSKADFFYKPGTNVLDSVNGYYLNTSTRYIHFTFEYDGGNISKTIRNEGLLIDTFTYAYDVTPNLFRNSNPLLYVYSDPLGQLSPVYYYDYPFYTMVFFFPKVFSGSTLNTFSYTSWGRIIHGKLSYTLSNDNKVSKEWYGGYGKEYLYK